MVISAVSGGVKLTGTLESITPVLQAEAAATTTTTATFIWVVRTHKT